MAERFKAPVLKTGDVQASVGSNPTLSARQFKRPARMSNEPDRFVGGRAEGEPGNSYLPRNSYSVPGILVVSPEFSR